MRLLGAAASGRQAAEPRGPAAGLRVCLCVQLLVWLQVAAARAEGAGGRRRPAQLHVVASGAARPRQHGVFLTQFWLAGVVLGCRAGRQGMALWHC